LGAILIAGAQSQKEKAAEAALRIMLKSVVALPPSIDVPRTIPIGFTYAALNGPTRSAAVPATAIVVIIVMMARADVDLESRGGDHAACGYCADHTESCSKLPYYSHFNLLAFGEITRNLGLQLHEWNLNGLFRLPRSKLWSEKVFEMTGGALLLFSALPLKLHAKQWSFLF
jgi:hypothetical protein